MTKLGKPQRSKKHKKLKSVGSDSRGKGGLRREEGLNQKPKSFTQEIPRKLKDLGIAIKDVQEGRLGKKSRNKYLKKPDAPKKTDVFTVKKNPTKPGKRHDNENPQSTYISTQKNKKMGKRKQLITKEAIDNYIDNLKPTRPLLESFKFKKRKDESESSFMRRVDIETDQAIKRSAIADQYDVSDTKKIQKLIKRKSAGKSDEKKEKLKSRKKRRAEARKEKNYDEFKDLEDKVKFGDIVHAPPALSVLPKKAVTVGADRPGLRMPELKEAFMTKSAKSSKKKACEKSSLPARGVGKTMKRKSLPLSQQIESDVARENFILAYRQMKGKKARLRD